MSLDLGPQELDLKFYSGDDVLFEILLRDDNGDPISTVGATALAQIKHCKTDVVAATSFGIVVNSSSLTLSLTETQTAALTKGYVWDLQVTFPTNDVITIAEGRLYIRGDVTR